MIAHGRALRIRVAGVVQGVGFRPFVHRLAHRCGLTGWVRNAEDGVRIHAQGPPEALDDFLVALQREAPPAARIETLRARPAEPEVHDGFSILESTTAAHPTARVSPDLAVCEDCLRELFAPGNRRYRYPYINCTNCGPRYSIVTGLPYDRNRTTMRSWTLCAACSREYADPGDRRFHAEPIACPACGPRYFLRDRGRIVEGHDAIVEAGRLLADGAIVAVKGLGGYHLACDAQNRNAVLALRERKFRKERPFAVMAKDAATASRLIELDDDARDLLTSVERPIVVAPAKTVLDGLAPETNELGVMLPYAPLHHLLYDAAAPPVLVMTSANRSSEPIAYEDAEALETLSGIPDAFLIGERPIARRVDDTVRRVTAGAPTVVRRARGCSPSGVATLPSRRTVLALGADLKNAVALVVDGTVFTSQHIGDLDQIAVRESLVSTIRSLCELYRIDVAETLIVHDLHPDYYTTRLAAELGGRSVAFQHHRAHVASVLAERDAYETEVLAFAFDGMGYGDDGSVWGGEVFTGSLAGGLRRIASLRPAALAGGDAAARFPVQAAAGFVDDAVAAALEEPPFRFPARFRHARALIAANAQTFPTTSAGRLFDAVAALLGFVREQTFEGQAAIWLEQQALRSGQTRPYRLPMHANHIDYAPLFADVVADRIAGRPISEIARACHAALAATIREIAAAFSGLPVVVSGGVFQNRLLVDDLERELGERLWRNRSVPANDGGICLGQAALAAAHDRCG